MAFDSNNRRSTRPDDGEAFLPDPSRVHGSLPVDDVESFAEEFIASAIGGESVEMEAQDEIVDEELGGPFLVVDAAPDTLNDGLDVDGIAPNAPNARRWLGGAADDDGVPPTRRFRKSGSRQAI